MTPGPIARELEGRPSTEHRLSTTAVVSELALWIGHALHTNPHAAELLGAVIIIAGVLELILDIGHRRVIALGGLLPAGGAAGARARPGSSQRRRRTAANIEDERR